MLSLGQNSYAVEENPKNILGKYLPVSFRGEESVLSIVRKSRVSLTPVGLGYFCLMFEVMLMLHHHFECSGWKLITEMSSHL